jgi:hypothetical protein
MRGNAYLCARVRSGIIRGGKRRCWASGEVSGAFLIDWFQRKFQAEFQRQYARECPAKLRGNKNPNQTRRSLKARVYFSKY